MGLVGESVERYESCMTHNESGERTTLVGESFSPWTKKARWALEQCGLSFNYTEYTPTISEPGLRWRMRQWSGSVSVPVLFVGPDVLRGSWKIAGHANQESGSHRLGTMDELADWDTLSEAALSEGRTRVVRAVLANEAALAEALPPFIPGSLRWPLRFLARDAAKVGEERFRVKSGDFLGYRAGGEAHTLKNTGASVLRCIVVGQRLDHDVRDYPKKEKRIYRNCGLEWNLVSLEHIDEPKAGTKK